NQSGFVSLKVFDVLGNEAAILVNQEKPAGSYAISFDGSGLSSGVYFYQLQKEGLFQTRKMILLK
ncbi:MAG TPA: T9SS type A sorting domain-containing protein, partial [Ignavibacteriaceae bacterium]